MSGVCLAVMDDLPGLMTLEMCFPQLQRWSEDSWREELVSEAHQVLVWHGSSGLDAAGTFAVCGDVVDLHRIVTAPSARRTGLARRLMEAGLEWAQTRGAVRMLLEVESANAAALTLYKSAGFRQISTRRDYYAPGAHAVILERDILQVSSSSGRVAPGEVGAGRVPSRPEEISSEGEPS